jgi:hypothetical protein
MAVARRATAFSASTNPVNFAILTTKASDAVSHIHDCWHSVMIEPLAREHRLAMQTPLLTISKSVLAVYGTPRAHNSARNSSSVSFPCFKMPCSVPRLRFARP